MRQSILRGVFTAAILLHFLSSHAQTIDVYIVDNNGPYTNIRNTPNKGKVVDRISVNVCAMLSLEKPTNGWWRIVGDSYEAITDEENSDSDFKKYHLKGSSTGYWIHYSVIGLGTRNYGGQHLPLRAEPHQTSAVTYTLKEEQIVRPVNVKGDWVKVKTIDGKGIGWIEAKWLCSNPLTNCC